MMNNLLNRAHLLFVSAILLVSFALIFMVIERFNYRWDATPEKIYSLAGETTESLKALGQERVKVIAFYPNSDTHREDFEIFLKACQMRHPNFQYFFYNPNKRPQLAKFWRVKELYTVIISYDGRQERLVLPNEEAFAGALLRLREPRETTLCFLREPEDKRLMSEKAEGFKLFQEILQDYNYSVHTVNLEDQAVPSFCQLLTILGPQSDWDNPELNLVRDALAGGQSVLFLIDPMDPGTGKSFIQFMRNYGVGLYSDVIVDKMSRMVGGDFLLPFVNQYDGEHPMIRKFNTPTFYPVARSVQPLAKAPRGIEVKAVAFSGSNSWAETDLTALEKGEAAFDSETDFPGPVSLAVTVAKVSDGSAPGALNAETFSRNRFAIVGDSDFLTNAYIGLSGNKEFVLRMIRWLANDERYFVFEDHNPQFQPLFLSKPQRMTMLIVSLLVLPLVFLIFGFAQNFWRKRSS